MNGLTDASWSWYLTLKKELMKLGAVALKYDQVIFTWYFGNKLQGIIATHVDFCFAWSMIFQTRLIDRLHVFEEVAEFQYPGVNMKNAENIKLG